MSLIAIQFSKTAREQVETALGYQERVKTQLLMRSAISQIYFNFFKNDPEQLSDKVISGVKWNLRGQPFKFSDEITIKIQAANGLLSPVTTPESLWLSTLDHLNIRGAEKSAIYNSISDWVDPDDNQSYSGAEAQYYRGMQVPGPRNGPMQDISELSYIKGVDAQLYKALAPMVTVYSVNSFNPSLAPPALIRALFQPEMANQIIGAQSRGEFTEATWRRIVGSRSYDFVDIHPGSTFLIEVTAQVGKIKLTRKFDIRVQAQKSVDPILTLASY